MIEVHGFLCGPRIYEFEGWKFEFGPICGPWPITKEGEPFKRAGKRFYAMFYRFNELPEAGREKYRVGGGCRSF